MSYLTVMHAETEEESLVLTGSVRDLVANSIMMHGSTTTLSAAAILSAKIVAKLSLSRATTRVSTLETGSIAGPKEQLPKISLLFLWRCDKMSTEESLSSAAEKLVIMI